MKTAILLDMFFAFCIGTSLSVGFDFIVYTIKPAPKSSSLSRRQWRIGFLTFIATISIYIVFYKI